MTSAINPVAFYLGSWPVHWYGLIIGLGMLVAYLLIVGEGRRFQIDDERMGDMFFGMMVAGFVGARIYYVLFNLDFYLAHPASILKIWEGGIAIYGGVIGGFIYVLYFSRRHQLNPWLLLDLIAPGLMAGQVIGRWGNFVNQEAHGGPVSRAFLASLHLPDWLIGQMQIQGQYYHPTFLYESAWNFIGLCLILGFRHRIQALKRGDVALFYLSWYGAGRFFIEGMRTDSLYWGPIRVSQLVAALSLIFSVIVFIYRHRDPGVPPYLLSPPTDCFNHQRGSKS